MSYPWNSFDTLTAADLNAAIGMASGTGGAGSDNAGRNLIHNSMFTITQRGAGGWSGNQYTADRWKIVSVNDTITVQIGQYTNAQRAIIGDEQANNMLFVNPVTGNGAPTSYSALTQPIEGVRRLAGKTVTVSFWAHSGTAGLKLGVSFDQIFGTGGSPSLSQTVNGQSVTLTTSPARYSLTFAIPSISAWTVGTNGDDCTNFDFWFSSGSTNSTRAGGVGVQTGQFVLWGVQLEIGIVATPLEKRDPVYELQQCLRTFCTFNVTTLCSVVTSINGHVNSVVFPVPMLKTPQFTATHIGGNVSLGALYNNAANTSVGIAMAGSPTVGNYEVMTIAASADL